MNIVDISCPVASVEVSEDDLQTLRRRASECGRAVRTYFLQGAEAAFDAAEKKDRERRELEAAEQKERERREYHEAAERYAEAMARPDRPGGKSWRGLGSRDVWGNRKRVGGVRPEKKLSTLPYDRRSQVRAISDDGGKS